MVLLERYNVKVTTLGLARQILGNDVKEATIGLGPLNLGNDVKEATLSQLWDDYNQIELVVLVFSDRFGRLVLE